MNWICWFNFRTSHTPPRRCFVVCRLFSLIFSTSLSFTHSDFFLNNQTQIGLSPNTPEKNERTLFVVHCDQSVNANKNKRHKGRKDNCIRYTHRTNNMPECWPSTVPIILWVVSVCVCVCRCILSPSRSKNNNNINNKCVYISHEIHSLCVINYGFGCLFNCRTVAFVWCDNVVVLRLFFLSFIFSVAVSEPTSMLVAQ